MGCCPGAAPAFTGSPGAPGTGFIGPDGAGPTGLPGPPGFGCPTTLSGGAGTAPMGAAPMGAAPTGAAPIGTGALTGPGPG